MQRKMRFNLWVLAILVMTPMIWAGTSEPVKEVDDGLDVYFRDTDLEALSGQIVPVYSEANPGESEKIARGFPGAPPSVPHTVDGMLPITGNDNECLECHHPENATDKKDVPLPKSHFERAVMGKGKRKDPMVWVVKDYKRLRDLVGTRYNCNMCHTPVATNVQTPLSTFVVEKE